MNFTITDILGETRNIAQLYAWTDGQGDHVAYTCPFCASGVDSIRNNGRCENPACSASKWASVESATRNREKTIALAKEEADRKLRHKQAMERIAEDNARRIREYQDFAMKVMQARGCLKCSNQYHGKIRKHRVACPKAA